MEKNQGGKWVVFAFEDEGGTNPGEPVTGDAANITANVRIDGGAVNEVDNTNPTELEDGYYIFDITAAESNGDLLLMAPASSTANVNVIGCPACIYTRPANFNALGIESDGHAHADLKQWLGVAPFALAAQRVQTDMVAIHGTALTETSGQLAGRFVDFFDQASAAFSVATALADFKATGFSTHDAAAVLTALGNGDWATEAGGTGDQFTGLPDVTLADGVTHGGTTAIFQMQRLIAENGGGETMTIGSSDPTSVAIALYGNGPNLGVIEIVPANVDDLGISTAFGWPVNVNLRMMPHVLAGGRAQAGTSGNVTLLASAPATDDIYNGSTIAIVDGTGVGQERLITDYNGTTKVATVNRAWDTNPDSDSWYTVVPAYSNTAAISDDVTAADNLEAAFDGTGYAFTGCTIPSVVGSVANVTGGINTAAGTITTLDGLDTAQDSQHSTTQSAIAGLNDYDGSDTSGTTTLVAQMSGITSLADWIGAVVGKSVDAATVAEINATTAGANYSNVTDSLEEVADDIQTLYNLAANPSSGFVGIRSGITTAQNDLDILTGTDGVTLATAQGNYAPAKAGDEMDLVDAPNATAVTAIQSGLVTAANMQTFGLDHFAEMIVDNGAGTMQFTVDALENAPGGGGSVTVGGFDAAALLELIQTDTGETTASAGSVGAIAQGAAGDPWSTSLPGAYGAGTAGYVLGTIAADGAGLSAIPWNSAWDAEVQSECADAITAASVSTFDPSDATHLAYFATVDTTQTSAASGSVSYLSRALFGSVVTVSGPVLDNSTLKLDQGSAYTEAKGDSVAFTNADGDWWGGDISGATPKLRVFQKSDDTEMFLVTGTVSAATGTQRFYFDLTSTQTGGLTSGVDQYEYTAWLFDVTEPHSIAGGPVEVRNTGQSSTG